MPAAAKPRPIPVKVVVVTMFEVGADTGDEPGELQYWVERDHLDRVYPMPAGYHAVRMNGHGEMAVLTGQGTAHAAATIMAVGLTRASTSATRIGCRRALRAEARTAFRWDRLSWARWVVDGDLGYEIDAREIPPDWSTGYVAVAQEAAI